MHSATKHQIVISKEKLAARRIAMLLMDGSVRGATN
jgi:hypothetical protein